MARYYHFNRGRAKELGQDKSSYQWEINSDLGAGLMLQNDLCIISYATAEPDPMSKEFLVVGCSTSPKSRNLEGA